MTRTKGHNRNARHNYDKWDFGFTKTYHHETKRRSIINVDVRIEVRDYAFSYDINCTTPRVRL